MRLERRPDGGLVVHGLTHRGVAVLRALPGWLSGEDAATHPADVQVHADPEDQDEWRRHAVPELEHLFASRADLLRRDLVTLRRTGPRTFRLRIDPRHATAWLASLNVATHALFDRHALAPTDLERDDLDAIQDPVRREAILAVHELNELIARWVRE